jgi:hypothetical protein
MQFEQRLKRGIRDGSITIAFRRWKRPQVVAGHRYRTGIDIVEMDAVDIVDPDVITPDDVRDAGYHSRDAALADLPGSDGLPIYRLRFHRVDAPDPRAQLAASGDLTDDDVIDIDRRLDRIDGASSHGPWTAAVLAAVAAHPAVRAADLAASLGRETQPFKLDVRKLKNLGLTLSLEVGYQLSPRGEAYLGRTARRPAG